MPPTRRARGFQSGLDVATARENWLWWLARSVCSRELAVHALGRATIGSMCKFGGGVVAKEVAFGTYANLGLKLASALMEGHAFEAGRVVRLGLAICGSWLLRT
jgi:hypothetical protein